jgi:hypothetical protein
MRSDTIKKIFQATGVWPMDAEVVLKRFNTTSEQYEASELGQHGDGGSWRELQKSYDASVPEKSKVEASSSRLHYYLHRRKTSSSTTRTTASTACLTLKRNKTKSKTMDLQQRRKYHGGAIFWSPRKVREAVKRDEAEQLQLQKARDRDLKEVRKLYQKLQAEAAKAARQHAAEERRKAKKVRAKALAAAWALKKLQREAATSQKSRDTLNKGKRKASRSAGNKNPKRRHVLGAASRADAAPEAPPPPSKTTRTCSIRPPKKYSE